MEVACKLLPSTDPINWEEVLIAVITDHVEYSIPWYVIVVQHEVNLGYQTMKPEDHWILTVPFTPLTPTQHQIRCVIQGDRFNETFSKVLLDHMEPLSLQEQSEAGNDHLTLTSTVMLYSAFRNLS